MIDDPAGTLATRKTLGKLVIGLTGGIGSGKTTVAQCFEDRGIAVVDTDAIAHQITAAGGQAVGAIAQRFGEQMITADGSLDRQKMRDLVFEDPQQRQGLEAILHPMIRAISDRQLDLAHSPYVLLAIPLLIESREPRERVHRILVVDCPESQQIERVMKRSGLSEARIRSIMAAQASREQRLAAADMVITNEGSLEAVEAQVEALHQRFLQEAHAVFGTRAAPGGQSSA